MTVIAVDKDSLCYDIRTLHTWNYEKFYIASSKDNKNHILIIPDNIESMYFDDNRSEIMGQDLWRYMLGVEGTLRVVGGNGLTSALYLFFECQAQSLDLTSFNTSNVRSMSHMFENCQAQSIYLSSFDTSNVIDMYSMFCGCMVQSLDLSSFDTSNVTDMGYMFFGL